MAVGRLIACLRGNEREEPGPRQLRRSKDYPVSFFLAEFHKGKTGADGIIEVTLKPSSNFAAPETVTLDQFCKKHHAKVIGVTPGLAGAAATVLICFETGIDQ